jgi:hypothetical protein
VITLDQHIGVRIPGGQPIQSKALVLNSASLKIPDYDAKYQRLAGVRESASVVYRNQPPPFLIGSFRSRRRSRSAKVTGSKSISRKTCCCLRTRTTQYLKRFEERTCSRSSRRRSCSHPSSFWQAARNNRRATLPIHARYASNSSSACGQKPRLRSVGLLSRMRTS